MSTAGFFLGSLFGLGLFLLGLTVVSRQVTLEKRIRPFVAAGQRMRQVEGERGPWLHLVADVQARAVRVLEEMGSTSASVARRLRQADLQMTVASMRLIQIGCALIFSILGLIFLAIFGFAAGGSWFFGLAALILCMAVGLLAPDYWLTRTARRRQVLLNSQVPDCAELLALAVAAGESVAAALARVHRLTPGPLGVEIGVAVARINSGISVPRALERLQDENDSPALGRLCEALVTAIERGTPLAQVLRTQSIDARELERRNLIEEGGRREIAMLVPVVFLILPITILFALYPGLISLRLNL